jgi:hypothetical protein
MTAIGHPNVILSAMGEERIIGRQAAGSIA